MNVYKILVIMLIFPLLCFSQSKKEDAYFIVNENSKSYVLSPHLNESKYESLHLYDSFSLYDKIDYLKKQEQIKKDSIDGKSYYDKIYIINLTFSIKSNKKEIITHCDIHELNLNIVNYNWLLNNSWKENNPNILFKDLYFLFKLEKNKYVKYKVERTVIAR